MSLWFVTPAWQRYELTAVCLEQRRRAIEELRAVGIDAYQVVIADDENLDIARSVGAAIIECPNFASDGDTILGRRWNLGTEFAAREGAEWFVQIGSDSWIDPAFFVPLLDPDGPTLTSTTYAAVLPNRIACLSVSPKALEHAAGPYVFHRSLLEASRFAPCEERSLFTDTSTVAGIERSNGRRIEWQTRDVQRFQYVGFRMAPLMTTYKALKRRWLVRESLRPWELLRLFYPEDLVEQARLVMQKEIDRGPRRLDPNRHRVAADA